MSKLLTICVPSYNVSRFIYKTITSILNIGSSLDLVEILIINDGSSDNTSEIVSKLETLYPQIKLINKKNGGYGSTINTAVELASGKYFKILDGDDTYHGNDLIVLLEYLSKTSVDLIITNYNLFFELSNKTIKVNVLPKKLQYDKLFTLQQYLDNNHEKLILPMHGYTIKTDLLKSNGVKIYENTFYTDVQFVFFPLLYVESIIFLNLHVYNYRLGDVNQSVSLNGFKKHYKDHISVTLSLIKYLHDKKFSPSLKRYFKYKILQLVSTQYKIFLTFTSNELLQNYKEIIEFHESIKMANNISNFNLTDKVLNEVL
jgi:glycosyltransferase involved in cell wall biosynthesis